MLHKLNRLIITVLAGAGLFLLSGCEFIEQMKQIDSEIDWFLWDSTRDFTAT
jgi:hypothetical protein